VVIINELLAQRQWPGESAVGKRVRLVRPGGDSTVWWTILGVVEASKNRGFAATRGRDQDIYLPLLQERVTSGALLVRTDEELSGVAKTLRKTVESVDPESPVLKVYQVRDRLVELSADDRFIGTVVTIFGAMAMVVAVVGLFALLAFSVRRRVQEIGLRMALGATPGKIFQLMTGYVLKLVLAGVALGWLACFTLSRFVFLESPQEATLHDVRFLIPVSLLLLLVSGIALWAPVRFAARIRPSAALRYE
jgi:hypothetical protein